MTITASARLDLIKVAVGLFDAAPGATYLSAFLPFAGNPAGLVSTLVADPAFTAIYPTFLTSDEFATKFVNSVVGSATVDATVKQNAINWISGRLTAGESRAAVLTDVLAELAAVPSTDRSWGDVAKQFNNKVAVAEYYSVTKAGTATDLTTLHNLVAGVTATTDVSSSAALETIISGPVAPVVNSFTLTSHVDTLTSTVAGATFNAPLADNTNTFQSGDVLVGTGAGNVLNLDLGNSANFAILATTSGIQTVNITAEAEAQVVTPFSQVTGNGATNNLSTLPVQINALRMANVTNWTDVQSRADVVIENIQLPTGNANGITSDVTFTMRDTQPGNMTSVGNSHVSTTYGPSFRAYFDPQALKRAGAVNTTTVKIEAGNSAAGVSDADFAAKPQKDLPYTGFSIVRDGTTIAINFSAQDVANLQGKTVTIGGVTASPAAGSSAGTQADLTAAIQNAVAAYNAANGTSIAVTVAANDYQYSSSDVPAVTRTVSSYTLSENGHVLTPPATNGWLAANGLPPTTGSNATIVAGDTSTATSLITSNLVLDNVGQGGFPQEQTYAGSTEGAGGDVIIGSMATSGGVQQFNVDVQRTSWIHSLQTTNNVLQVVNIKSDATASPTTGGQGLAIGAEIVPGNSDLVNWAAPGTYVGTNGLTDVKTIDATAFKGSLEIGESITQQGFAKNLAQNTGLQAYSITLGDNSNGVVIPAAQNGSTGLNSSNGSYNTAYQPVSFNSVNLDINASVAASGNFRETVTGSGANDYVHLSHSGQSLNGAAWVDALTRNEAANVPTAQKAGIYLNLGEGNNVVQYEGAGAAVVTTGAGNDAVYVDNTGVSTDGNTKAAWVANASSSSSVTTAPVVVETVAGLGAVAQKETTYWTGVNTATLLPGGDATVTEIVATGADPVKQAKGITVVATQYGDPVAHLGLVALKNVTSQNIADAVQQYFNAKATPATPQALGTAVTYYISAAGTVSATSAIGDTGSVSVAIGSSYVVSSSPTDLAQGSNTVTSATPGLTQVYSSGPVTNAIGTLGSDAVAEAINVTWQSLQGNGASETVAGITVTNTDGSSTVHTGADVAAAVFTAYGLLTGPQKTAGATIAVGSLNVTFAAANPWTPAAPGLTPATAATTGLTYGTPGVFSSALPSGTGTSGIIDGNTAVSLDAYGNFITYGATQTGAANHTFTGSGETVTVTYEGVSKTVTITPASSNVGATYTTTDINNAILTAVNNDATLSKLLTATAGSASASVILSSKIDGTHAAPTITFGHTGTTGITTGNSSGTYTVAQAAADSAALALISNVAKATQDGTTTHSDETNGALTGGHSGVVNNTTITDNGSTTGVSNVFDLSSNINSHNTVTLTGTGSTIITNYKVATDTINTVATHGVVINSLGDVFQAAYTQAGDLNITAANLGLTAAGNVYFGNSLATATKIAGTGTGAGIVVIENAATNTTSIYYDADVVTNGVADAAVEANIVGVAPTAAHVHLV